MPRPGLPPTPASSTDIQGKRPELHLADTNMFSTLPPPAMPSDSNQSSSAASVASDSSYHPVSPTSPAGKATSAKGRKASTSTKHNALATTTTTMTAGDFPLPQPPTRSRKIIQMHPGSNKVGTSNSSAATSTSPTKKGNTTNAGTSSTAKKQPSSTSAAGRKIARKTAHSLIERRRRSKMNEEFGVLKDMIPACRNQEMHKLAILQASIEYLRYLERCVSGLQNASAMTSSRSQNGSKRRRDDSRASTPRQETPGLDTTMGRVGYGALREEDDEDERGSDEDEDEDERQNYAQGADLDEDEEDGDSDGDQRMVDSPHDSPYFSGGISSSTHSVPSTNPSPAILPFSSSRPSTSQTPTPKSSFNTPASIANSASASNPPTPYPPVSNFALPSPSIYANYHHHQQQSSQATHPIHSHATSSSNLSRPPRSTTINSYQNHSPFSPIAASTPSTLASSMSSHQHPYHQQQHSQQHTPYTLSGQASPAILPEVMMLDTMGVAGEVDGDGDVQRREATAALLMLKRIDRRRGSGGVVNGNANANGSNRGMSVKDLLSS
ncbi:hypothetical protein MMC25_007809 [Agyrium rufum]|nr:hypothetical protein [Agyrium rufum]